MTDRIYISPDEAKKNQAVNAPKRPFPVFESLLLFCASTAAVVLTGFDFYTWVVPCAVLALAYGYERSKLPSQVPLPEIE
jgi:hypothetical protein